MKELVKKVKKVVKEHPLATGVLILVGTKMIIGISHLRNHSSKAPVIQPVKYEPLPDREFNFTVGKEQWNEIGNNWIEIMVDEVHTDNLGKLGEELVASIPELTAVDNKVQVMVNAYDLKRNN